MKVVVIGGIAAGLSAASQVKRLEPKAHVVVLGKGRDVSYAAGNRPRRIDRPAFDADDVFFKTLDDTRRTKAFLRDRSPKTAVLVGAGYTNLELADVLCNLKVKVVVLEKALAVLPAFCKAVSKSPGSGWTSYAPKAGDRSNGRMTPASKRYSGPRKRGIEADGSLTSSRATGSGDISWNGARHDPQAIRADGHADSAVMPLLIPIVILLLPAIACVDVQQLFPGRSGVP